MPQAWYPLGHGDKALLEEPLFTELGKKYGKSNAQIILRWHIQAGNIVIPGSKNPQHIKANFDLFDFDEYYGSDKARSAYNGLLTAYQNAGWTQDDIEKVLQLEILDNAFSMKKAFTTTTAVPMFYLTMQKI